jgi:hypothetical protein
VAREEPDKDGFGFFVSGARMLSDGTWVTFAPRAKTFLGGRIVAKKKAAKKAVKKAAPKKKAAKKKAKKK